MYGACGRAAQWGTERSPSLQRRITFEIERGLANTETSCLFAKSGLLRCRRNNDKQQRNDKQAKAKQHKAEQQQQISYRNLHDNVN
jgi:hypothetical protein